MNIRKCLLLFTLCCSFLFAEDEIVVQLTSESDLSPAYLCGFEQKATTFDPSYVEQLENILRFDLQNCGMLYVMPKSSRGESIAKKEGEWKIFHQGAWKEIPTHFVVKGKVEKQVLSAAIFAVHPNTIKGIEGIQLSGVLAEDRRKIHELADTIYESLFQKKGVASSRILFTLRKQTAQGEWQTDVWESDYDGANARQLTQDGFLCVTPTYIPGKTSGRCSQFLYVSYKVGQPKIFAASTQDGAGKRLTYLRGNQLMPVISPRRDLLAFVSDITGNPELFIQPFSPEKGLHGKPRQIFSAPSGAQASPTFSPDGKRIAFVSNKDGSPRIYVLNIPSPETPLKEVVPVLISKQNKDNTCPAWSPDGTKIAYSSAVKGVRQIWIYDFIEKKEKQLTDGPGHKENPAWAPDSFHLLFNSSSSSSSELFLINLKQKEAVKISKGAGEKRFPAWEL